MALSAPTVLDRYDAVVMDLDGVVYRGDRVVPGAARALPQIRARVPVVFLTNNSARTRQEVAERLEGMGVQASPDEVLTSAVATATMLRHETEASANTPDGARTAYVIGERGIREALAAADIRIVDGQPERTDLVVVGWDRQADYDRLRTASLLVERGARLIATNPDASYPAQDGLWPGAGALLAVITTTTGATATVVGKPNVPMFEVAAAMAGASRPLMVGDRLDTDIAGAAAAGWDSMLVLSGASTIRELSVSTALPTYVGGDLAGVLDARAPAHVRPGTSSDLGAVRALLERSSLPPPIEWLDGTLVVDDPNRPGDLAATATLQSLDGHRYLRSVVVRADLRGTGLGLLVTASAVRSAAKRPIYLFTDTAAAFFERLGFEPISHPRLPQAVADAGESQGCDQGATAMVWRPPAAA